MEDLIFADSIKKMPLMALPVRSTLVKLKSAQVLISPGSTMDSDQLESLKPVTDIVAPSLFHCAGAPLAAKIFRNAKIWGPEGAKTVKPNINWCENF